MKIDDKPILVILQVLYPKKYEGDKLLCDPQRNTTQNPPKFAR